MEKLNFLGRFRKPKQDDELRNLELKLQSVLTPVPPRAEFVSDLRFNLIRQNFRRELFPPENNQLQDVFLIITGFVGIALALISGVRGVISLFSVIGLFVSWFRQNQQKSELA